MFRQWLPACQKLKDFGTACPRDVLCMPPQLPRAQQKRWALAMSQDLLDRVALTRAPFPSFLYQRKEGQTNINFCLDRAFCVKNPTSDARFWLRQGRQANLKILLSKRALGLPWNARDGSAPFHGQGDAVRNAWNSRQLKRILSYFIVPDFPKFNVAEPPTGADQRCLISPDIAYPPMAQHQRISENASGRKMRLLMFETISASLSPGCARSFCHSASAPNAFHRRSRAARSSYESI